MADRTPPTYLDADGTHPGGSFHDTDKIVALMAEYMEKHREIQNAKYEQVISDALNAYPVFPKFVNFAHAFMNGDRERQTAIADAFVARLGLTSREGHRLVNMLMEHSFLNVQMKTMMIELEGEIACMDKVSSIMGLYLQHERDERKGAMVPPHVDYTVPFGHEFAFPVDGTMDAWLAYVDSLFALLRGEQQEFLTARATLVALYREKGHRAVRLVR